MKTSKMPQPASSAIVERDGRYLLVLRTKPPSDAMYAFPGGRGEPALRELFEETGLRAEKPVLFATYDLPGHEDGPGSPSFFLSVFKVKADENAVAVAADDAASVGWYTAGEIEKMPAPDSVRECIRRLEAERAELSA